MNEPYTDPAVGSRVDFEVFAFSKAVLNKCLDYHNVEKSCLCIGSDCTIPMYDWDHIVDICHCWQVCDAYWSII